ncbi:LutC/YkgG family protein [Sinomicrobium weinanense]|uniref:LUD domain-containing protein n=1 Tax=Sinomicrobium weinanense TaxID=2842200 RepID=A0A926Q4L6_9FLAO|nr:LUD domain-containing protein [Sinomicrobium weinanense]MBC9798114.1 LUD domain-containing protein [Sinomicrobium weinanense]MBU3122992.1 LUD domain-containing protein [Sinomicrobium weinanense]
MNSKEKILDSLKKACGDPLPRPEIDLLYDKTALVEEYVRTAEASGTEVFLGEEENITGIITQWSEGQKIQSSVPRLREKYPLVFDEDMPFDQDNIPGVFVAEASFGVVENAALWFTDEELTSRLLAFIPEKLIILLSRNHLVATMHEAYARIEEGKTFGFGLFMAGPSKTADIEQTLVKGAQGAKELAVILY